MTDRPMDADATEHPDEGTIHAWLDDALGAAEAERLAAHVRTCAECQARVAEARGLIAGASRIVAALDDVPVGTRPQWAQGTVVPGSAAAAAEPGPVGEPIPQASLWRWLRVTPGRAALAATILVAVGITLTYQRTAVDSTPRSTMVLNPQQADVPASTSPEGAASNAAKPRDPLLDSAVAKNVVIAQGRREIGAAPGPNLPAAPPPGTTLQEPAAGAAVARGRAAVEAQRESTLAVADRFRDRAARPSVAGGVVAGLPSPATRAAAAPSAADAAASGAAMAKVRSDAVASSCVRLDSPDADARWADQSFPLLIALDSAAAEGRRPAPVLTATGETTQLRATWVPRGDSVLVRLARIGYSGSIALGPDVGVRSGLAVSAASVALEEVVVAPSEPARAAAPRPEARKAEAAAARPTPTPPAGPPVRQLRVTARVVPCPSR
jgi:hypothetical protein